MKSVKYLADIFLTEYSGGNVMKSANVRNQGLNWGNYVKVINKLGGNLFRQGALNLPTEITGRMNVAPGRSALVVRSAFADVRSCLVGTSSANSVPRVSVVPTRSVIIDKNETPVQFLGHCSDISEIKQRAEWLSNLGLVLTTSRVPLEKAKYLFAITEPILGLFWQLSPVLNRWNLGTTGSYHGSFISSCSNVTYMGWEIYLHDDKEMKAVGARAADAIGAKFTDDFGNYRIASAAQ